MEQEVFVKKDVYRDSVSLMMLMDRLKKMGGITNVAILMGTQTNKELFRVAGFTTAKIQSAGSNDLCIGIEAKNKTYIQEAQVVIDRFLSGESRTGGLLGDVFPRSLSSALKMMPDAKLVSISLPGKYAAAEAEKALHLGLHVFLFSNNVTILDELRLKELARQRGLLLMGPDCGTAIINGHALGFSNKVQRGQVGIIAASGTGAQEVMCILSNLGIGISHVIGTGGRDLVDQIGGMTFTIALDALLKDKCTKVIILISKIPSPSIEKHIFTLLERCDKSVVVIFIGQQLLEKRINDNIWVVRSLAHAASVAAAIVNGTDVPEPLTMEYINKKHRGLLEPIRNNLNGDQRFVRGLFVGGTLANEAAFTLSQIFPNVHAGHGFGKVLPIKNWDRLIGHTLLDLGDDRFTIGKPHPMIDPSIRNEMILREAEDSTVAVILLDFILGYNTMDDPVGSHLWTIRQARRTANERGRILPIVAHVCGTEGDPQKLSTQIKQLEDAEIKVFSSNLEATLAAAWIASHEMDDGVKNEEVCKS